MGVSLKTENEEGSRNSSQTRGSEGGRRGLPAPGGAEGDQGFTGTCPGGFIWRVSRQPSARLTHDPKPATAMWLLRSSVLRETPIASAIHFKQLKSYDQC
jgi:hypothetical protein